MTASTAPTSSSSPAPAPPATSPPPSARRSRTLPSAKEFVANYKAEGYKEAYEAYGGYSYDSAWAIIEAVKKVVDDNDGKLPDDARAKVAEAMQNVSFDGVTGKVSFDEYGDATNKQLTVYEVENGTWAPVKSGTYTG